MTQAFQVVAGPIYQPENPARNPRYTRWIKRFSCLACHTTRFVDPCHTGPHGLGIKSSDYSCIPLCRKCHAKFDADPRAFARQHHLKIRTWILFFNRLWQRKLEDGRKATGQRRAIQLDRSKPQMSKPSKEHLWVG